MLGFGAVQRFANIVDLVKSFQTFSSKIGFDTAENESPEVSKSLKNLGEVLNSLMILKKTLCLCM